MHASGRVRVDALDEQGILNQETKIYSHQLSHLRRIMAE
jgi:gamma-D-glutamyl-L-lysine dipeptidyl-peptidase